MDKEIRKKDEKEMVKENTFFTDDQKEMLEMVSNLRASWAEKSFELLELIDRRTERSMDFVKELMIKPED